MPLSSDNKVFNTKPLAHQKQPLNLRVEDFDDDNVLLPPNYKTMYPFTRSMNDKRDTDVRDSQMGDPLYQGLDNTDSSLAHHNVAPPVYGSSATSNSNERSSRNPRRVWTPIRLSLMIFNVLLLVYALFVPVFGTPTVVVAHSSGSSSWKDDPIKNITYQWWLGTIIILLPAAVTGIVAFGRGRYISKWYIAYLILLGLTFVTHVAQLIMYIVFCFRRQHTETAPEIGEIGFIFALFFTFAAIFILVIMLTCVDMNRGKKFEAAQREEGTSEPETEPGTDTTV
jgi:hypothetical protein